MHPSGPNRIPLQPRGLPLWRRGRAPDWNGHLPRPGPALVEKLLRASGAQAAITKPHKSTPLAKVMRQQLRGRRIKWFAGQGSSCPTRLRQSRQLLACSSPGVLSPLTKFGRRCSPADAALQYPVHSGGVRAQNVAATRRGNDLFSTTYASNKRVWIAGAWREGSGPGPVATVSWLGSVRPTRVTPSQEGEPVRVNGDSVCCAHCEVHRKCDRPKIARPATPGSSGE